MRNPVASKFFIANFVCDSMVEGHPAGFWAKKTYQEQHSVCIFRKTYWHAFF